MYTSSIKSRYSDPNKNRNSKWETLREAIVTSANETMKKGMNDRCNYRHEH